MVLGTIAAYHLLNFDLPTSALLASMFASHTLLAYPIASRYGITRIRAVTLTIGGTIVTDILALLVLAGIVGMYKGDITSSFWIRLVISTFIFAAIVFFIFPLIARWFFKKFDDNVSQYIFVLAIVFLGAFLAEAAGLEAIIGAFISGLALNKFIPHSSPLMNRIEFVGNALFIPFFLIGVGMLVDFSVLFKGLGALKVAGVMIVLAVATKYLAALLMQKTFKMSADERQIIFGLSNARVGATLAVVLVGYNVILGETAAGEPIRLLNEDVLNGTIIMILVTCTISSFVVEKASRKIAITEGAKKDVTPNEEQERILISLAYPETVNNLIDLAFLLQPDKHKSPLFALHVVDEQDTTGEGKASGKRMMENAIKHAAATDNTIVPLNRFDLNISNGIVYTIKEQNITDVIIGLHHLAHKRDQFFGPTTEKILEKTSETVFIYKALQPINTLKRIIVLAPHNAEFEKGFAHWFSRIVNISRETGLPLHIHAGQTTLDLLQKMNDNIQPSLNINFTVFDEWQDFLVFTREVKQDDLFIIISSRKGYLSYSADLEKLPKHLVKYFSNTSYVILFPEQMADYKESDLRPLQQNVQVLEKAGEYVKSIFAKSR